MLCVAHARVGVAARGRGGRCGTATRLHEGTRARGVGRARDGPRPRCAARAGARARAAIEVTTGPAWTRKTPLRVTRRPCSGAGSRSTRRACSTSPRGRHARRTSWLWSAGAGVDPRARPSTGTSSQGLHDGAPSERTVWVDGEPHEVGPSAVRRPRGRRRSALHRARRLRARRENYLVIASDYEQPFGTFTGALPVAGELARARRDGAPRGALVSSSARSRSSRSSPRSPPRSSRDRAARGARGARRAPRVLLAPACCRGTTRWTRRGRSAPTLVVLASLLVLGEGCERAGLFDALAARMAAGARGVRAAAARAGVRRRRGGDRGARARRHRRAAHARRVRGRGQGAAARAARTCTRARTWPTRASLLLPISNLTNLLAFRASELSFAGFAALMALPWAVAIAIEWAVLRRVFARALEARRPDAARTRAAAARAAPLACSRSRSPASSRRARSGSTPPGRPRPARCDHGGRCARAVAAARRRPRRCSGSCSASG